MAELTNLKDTVDKMLSDDYRDRFIAEYWQTRIRYNKLKSFCNRIEAAEMTMTMSEAPKHDCPLFLLREQQKSMGEYLHVLELRAVIEKVDLDVGVVNDLPCNKDFDSAKASTIYVDQSQSPWNVTGYNAMKNIPEANSSGY